MIEPPSFLEKMMVINKAAANTKLGKIAGKATLGAVPVALTITALSARAYGASRHFVMDKLNPHQSDKKSFSQRLTEIKNREGYKGDLKKIAKLETLREKALSGRVCCGRDTPKKMRPTQKISCFQRMLCLTPI